MGAKEKLPELDEVEKEAQRKKLNDEFEKKRAEQTEEFNKKAHTVQNTKQEGDKVSTKTHQLHTDPLTGKKINKTIIETVCKITGKVEKREMETSHQVFKINKDGAPKPNEDQNNAKLNLDSKTKTIVDDLS